MQAIDKAFVRNAALLLASENWAEGYQNAPTQYAKLLITAGRLERKLLQFFKDQAEHSSQFVNWYAYMAALQEVKATKVDAYNVNVIVTDDVAKDNNAFVNVIFDEVANATALGAQAGETTYGYPLGLSPTSSSIQRQARAQVAALVGKKVLPDGSVVDNPNAQYVISNTTRKKIQDAIHTSLMLGEDVQKATARVKSVIQDPKRAALIAQQETAMAYTSGLHNYGAASGAVGKEWEDNGAKDICAVNTAAGPIPFDEAYPGGVQHPTQHIGCKCYERLIYQNELTQNPKLFDHPRPTPPDNLPSNPRAPRVKAPAAVKVTPVDTAPAPTRTVSFTKGSVTTNFAINDLEHRIISDNNIDMNTQAPRSRTRWPAKTLGMYIEYYGDNSKAMHLRDPSAASAMHTFYHEIGHAIDHNYQTTGLLTDTYTGNGSQAILDAWKAERDALYALRITKQYSDKLTPEEVKTVIAGGGASYTKTVRGRTATYLVRIRSSYVTYAKSMSEIFAEAYAYYRLDPALLQKIAPKFYAAIKELK